MFPKAQCPAETLFELGMGIISGFQLSLMLIGNLFIYAIPSIFDILSVGFLLIE